MVTRGLPGWCKVLGLSLAVCIPDLATWPGCPCDPRSHGNCSRVLSRGTPDNNTQVLNLRNCNINEIGSRDFLLPNVRWVDLKNNSIEVIDANVFDTLTNMKYLTVEHNKIRGKFIHPEAFRYCTRLEGVGFSGNDMREAPSDLMLGLYSLKLLFFSHCSLDKIPLFATRMFNLEHLDLGNNKITLNDPNTFSSLRQLRNLYLRHNQIEFVPEEIFASLSNINKLHLNHNRIKYIPDKLFTHLVNLKHLRLQHNRIEYLSPITFKNCKRLEEVNVSNNRITHLPENFLSVSSQPKRFFFSGNPWQCGCLTRLLAEIKLKQIKYNKNDYNGHKVACVMKTKDFLCHRNSDYLKLYDEISTSTGTF